MDIHKPKAAHSWREFLIEIGTIICGILIALGLEQGIEAFRTHETVEALKSVLNRELASNRARYERLRDSDACSERLIRELVVWATKAPPGVVHGDLSIARPALGTSSWELARSNPAFAHLPLEEQTAYSTVYNMIGNQQHFLFDEQETWRAIKGSLPFSGDPAVRSNMVPLLTAALGYQRGRQMNYDYIFQKLDELHITADKNDALGRREINRCDQGH